MKSALKTFLNAISLLVVFPSALLAGFGKFEKPFSVFSHFYSTIPGVVGEFVRRAYYRLTLKFCSQNCMISFGTFFAHSNATVGNGVYIGAYCLIGCADIGPGTQIASGVHILSGRHQHKRKGDGQVGDGGFSSITIGQNCWIGECAVIMNEVGDGCTIGAGSVVVHKIPAASTAVGNPAHVVKQAEAPDSGIKQ